MYLLPAHRQPSMRLGLTSQPAGPALDPDEEAHRNGGAGEPEQEASDHQQGDDMHDAAGVNASFDKTPSDTSKSAPKGKGTSAGAALALASFARNSHRAAGSSEGCIKLQALSAAHQLTAAVQ